MSGLGKLLTAVVLLAAGAGTEAAARDFERIGFVPQVVAEGTHRISGSEALLDQRFDTEIVFAPDGLRSSRAGGAPALVRGLPVAALDPSLRDRIDAAGFEAPIDFEPVGFDQMSVSAPQEESMTTLSAAVVLKSPADTRSAANGFTRLGFSVTTINPGVLLLTAEAGVFEICFGTQFTVDDAGARRIAGGAETRMLLMDALPSPLREMVAEAEFESPPDFGPTNF